MIVAALFALLVQDQIDNPEYKGWASFKPGSSVTYKVVTNLNPQGGEQKSTLKSLGETEAVLEVEMSNAAGKTMERKIPAKVPASKAPKNVKEGEEEIEVAGKTLKCKTREFEVTAANGKVMNMKVWGNEDIPGRAAKVEITADGFKSSMVASTWEKK